MFATLMVLRYSQRNRIFRGFASHSGLHVHLLHPQMWSTIQQGTQHSFVHCIFDKDGCTADKLAGRQTHCK